MIIFAKQDDFGWFSTGNEKNPLVGEFSLSDKVDTVVDWIYDTYDSNPGFIDCLFLCAHGNSGMIALGDWVGPIKAAKFAKLKGTFKANSRGIEIHGCASASASNITEWDGTGTASKFGKGYDFLKNLAVSAGVKVTAPIDSIWGFNAAYSYKDVRTMTVMPGGSAYFKYA
ncbi:MAG: hypothetical protein ABJA66_04340 [Actinomycetota bacterium]